MIARGFITMHHVVSKSNVADIVTKHCRHNSVYHLLRPVFGHKGDTDELWDVYRDNSSEALAAQYPDERHLENICFTYECMTTTSMELYIDWPVRDGQNTHSLNQMGIIKYHTAVRLFGT